jgi:hypothetical protein
MPHKDPEVRKEWNKKYYIDKREEIRSKQNAYYEKYYEEQHEQVRERINVRRAERQLTDPIYVIAKNLRRRLQHALAGRVKKGSAVRDLGCTVPELKEHIEKQFQPGMSWKNYGIKGWTIDHIKALANFDLENRQQFIEASHFTNLQPMWHIDNIIKSDN